LATLPRCCGEEGDQVAGKLRLLCVWFLVVTLWLLGVSFWFFYWLQKLLEQGGTDLIEVLFIICVPVETYFIFLILRRTKGNFGRQNKRAIVSVVTLLVIVIAAFCDHPWH
jgi:O-antigen/teichoic acid export membrane protein